MSYRKTNPQNSKIKVLLIAEGDLVLEGWKLALSSSVDIELLDMPKRISFAKPVKLKDAPEIVVVEASWLNSSERCNWIVSLKSKYRTKTIAILANAKEVRKAKQLGIDEAIHSPFSSQQLVQLIRGLSRDDKGLCMYYAEQLANMPTGEKYFNQYVELVSNIFQLAFAQILTNPRLKRTISSDGKFAHLTFENSSGQRFWSEIRKRFGANYVVLSVQNDPDMLGVQFSRLGIHLSEPIGKFGVINNRKSPNESSGMFQLSMYRNEEKFIIVLLDKQIRALLALKAAGVEPTELVEDIYQELIIAINETRK